MVGNDPSRFDYLFEPVDGNAEIAGDGRVEVIDDAPVRSGPSFQRSWLAIVAATIVGVGIGMLVLWPSPVDAVEAPPGVPTSAPPVATSSPVVAQPPESVPSPEPAPEPSTLDPGPGPAPQPASPVATPSAPVPASPAAPAPPAAKPPTPIVRAPMSVSPEPRPAFPNQQPPDNNKDRGGGLLGRGGLL